MELYKKIFKQKNTLYILIFLIIYFIICMKYSYAKGEDIIDANFDMFSGYSTYLILVPIFLLLNVNNYKVMYKYNIMIRHSSIHSWWKKVTKISGILSFLYVTLMYLIFFITYLLLYKKGVQANKDIFIFFFTLLMMEYMLYFFICIINNTITYLCKNPYVGSIAVTLILLLISSTGRVLKLKFLQIDKVILVFSEANLKDYSSKIYFAFLIIILIEILKIVNSYILDKKDVYWNE